MTLTNEAISAAQGLASLGWLVFPVNPDTKAPLITGWQSRATCDRCSIIDLFEGYPSAAIGLVTGQKSGLVVIDIDERENFSGLQNFKNAGFELSPTVSASTPRGGIHLYFKSPLCEVPCSVSKIAEGIDVKADGGYIIAPPSITKWGKYSWECSYQIFQKGPLPLPEKFYLPVGHKQPFKGSGSALGSVSFRLLDPILKGNRNDEITRRIGYLLAKYDAFHSWEMAKLINQECCLPPLGETELSNTFKSIRKKEGK